MKLLGSALADIDPAEQAVKSWPVAKGICASSGRGWVTTTLYLYAFVELADGEQLVEPYKL